MSRILSVSLPNDVYDWIMSLPIDEKKDIYNAMREFLKDARDGKSSLTDEERADILSEFEVWCKERFGEKK